MFPVLLQIAAIVAVATVAVEEEEEIFILHVVWKRGSMEWRLSAVQAEVQCKLTKIFERTPRFSVFYYKKTKE